MESVGGNMKVFCKKYILFFLYFFLGYTLLLLPLFWGTNPFANYFNYSMILALFYFLALRFLDDYQDFYQDRIQGKALFPRGIVLLLCMVFLF